MLKELCQEAELNLIKIVPKAFVFPSVRGNKKGNINYHENYIKFNY